MKWLRVVGLGIAIWGLSLLWPDVNRVLTPLLMSGLGLGLGVVILVYVLSRHLGRHHPNHGAGQNHATRPIPVVSTR
jgi:hypothetical protein